ncbi:MAG TPA: hypothetical protein PKM73_18140 [Verrucomicrobiota bacterium]|nr:hypothetical protein [Verrucomicrobiota bacterium]HNU53345.1 hypothetical protein [Verrucomicrobiota bacterium]
MAILQQPTNHTNPFAEKIGDALAPAGTFIATIADIHDEFDVVRQKYQSTETEKVDLTTFLFGFRDAAGNPHRVASRRMKISGNEKSALFGFLKSILGKAPSYGWDYMSLKGAKVLLTVEHVRRRDGSGVFAAIASLSPVPVGFVQAAGPAPAVQPVTQPAAAATLPRPQPVPAPASPPPPVQPPAAPSVTPAEDDEVPF